jgi:ATP-dependent DNA ligase
MARIGDSVELYSRTGNARREDHISRWLEQFGIPCLLDGELHVDGGRLPDLMLSKPRTYTVFDVLEVEGQDITQLTLAARRRILDLMFKAWPADAPVGLVSQVGGRGAAALYARTVGGGGEGIVVKDAASTYAVGKRCSSWRKFKP